MKSTHTFKTNKQNEYVACLFQLNTIISAKAGFGKSVKEHQIWGRLTILGREKGCLLRFIQLVLTLKELFLRISTYYLDTLDFVKGLEGEYLETKVSAMRNGEKQLWDIKARKGHSEKLSLLKCFIGDTGLIGALFPIDC